MIGHVIGVVAGGVCAGAFGVFEHVSEIETYVLHKRERLEMVVFRFGRIAGNHIHSDAAIGDFFSYTVYKRYVFFPRVSAAHVAQYTARAALERQVEITADVFVCGYNVEYVICHVVRVGRAEAYSHVWESLGYGIQKAGKAQCRRFCLFRCFVEVFFCASTVPQV